MPDETTPTTPAAATPATSSAPVPAAPAGAKPGGKPGEKADATTKPAEPTDDLVATKHTLKVGRRTLAYTATTGRVVLRDEVYEDGVFTGFKAKAEMSMTSYVLDDADRPSRPVTFAFNGGPGSSSVWLHLGLLGPRRILMGDVGDLLPPPYGIADNAESLLAVSDLVFIDPVSTGYSRTVEGTKPERVPRLHRRHRVGGRADPDLDLAAQALDVAEVRGRRVLRHHPRRRAGRAPAVPARHVRQRPDADLQRARLRLDRLREPAQRPGARALPADVRRDRALPRQGQAARCKRSSRRPRSTPRASTPGCSPRATGSPARSGPPR